MSNTAKTLEQVLRGNADANVRFVDLCSLLRHLGFSERVRGDHHIFTHNQIADILNIQPKGGKAKPYQVRQVRNVLTANRLVPEPTDE